MIFNNYTGNAMFNNALMTIEALGKLNNVSEITPNVLLNLYEEKDLANLNLRLKSYYMLFLNNPLINKPKIGKEIYESLLFSILRDCDFDGINVCQLTGLNFEKSFDFFYQKEIERQKTKVQESITEKKQLKKILKQLDDTDLSINRAWFPLIGGLGSDAQALPQAKFAIKIHPICIAIMQFLPLSSLLYKGGVLLIDSSNFEFSQSFIESNVKEVENRIQTTSSNKSIENIKFAKGNYLLKAIGILEEKEIEDEYSDLNLWSFSNSGTGASCEIERVPNSLIKKLIWMKQNTKISNELKSILNRDAHRFLEDLENNQEWYLLYPNVLGKGKNKGDYEGVSVAFLEAYFKEIGSIQKINYAKYLAYLIEKYKTDSFAKYLSKRDAWRDKEFANDLYVVLVKATENGEWDLLQHIAILDDAEQVPVKNNIYSILKITHFYYYKKAFNSQLPDLGQMKSSTQEICEWILAYIQNDNKLESLKKDLLSPQNYFSVNYTNVFYRASQSNSLNLKSIFYALYDQNFRSSRYGLNSLLRIFFSQPNRKTFKIEPLKKVKDWTIDNSTEKWLEEIRSFAEDYQMYYFDKYENKETGSKPFDKFLSLIKAIKNENSKFLIWFYEAVERSNEFLKEGDKKVPDKWSENLLYEPNGEFALSFARFAIKFSLLKQYHLTINTTHNLLITTKF